MTPHKRRTAGLAAEVERALEQLRAQGSLEVSEGDTLLAELSPMQFEVRDEPRGTFLHLWSEERNLVRRVLAVAEQSAEHLELDVSRFGRAQPARLTFSLPTAMRTPQRLSRERFRLQLRRLLEQHFPDEDVLALTSAPDLEHSLSGSYVRGVMRSGAAEHALLAAAAGEDASTLDAMLTFGLLWLDRCRQMASRRALRSLRLFFPLAEGVEAARLTAHRLAALVPEASVELFTHDVRAARMTRLDASDRGNIQTWLSPAREFERLRESAREIAERLIALAPAAVDTVVRVSPAGEATDLLFRFRGLPFARWHAGRVYCATSLDGADFAEQLWDGNWRTLEELVSTLAEHRTAGARDRNHPLYRAAPERWLEQLLAADITRIEPALRREHVYAQVPSLGPGRSVLDVLAVTREGRLAVVELKASEDLHLVLQGADYWLRVKWHLEHGDFERHGYFRGVELQAKPPLLFLVAPGLRFHPATDVLKKYVAPEIELVRVGLNENWREGLQVVLRQ
jgi:hypothetical protein